MRQGDFSEFSGALYDPFSVHTVSGAPMRDPLPGNIVPKQRWDPVAVKVMEFMPRPNVTPLNPFTNTNNGGNTKTTHRRDSEGNALGYSTDRTRVGSE